MKRQYLCRLAALVLAAGLLCGCGAATTSSDAPAADSAAASLETPAGSDAGRAADTSGAADADSLPEGASPLAAGWPEADVEVDEPMYVNWVNELNWNCELYLEKTVRIQGMYTSEVPDAMETVFSYVYRVGPGCCGTDGTLCGLQILLPEGAAPEEGDWMDLYGTLRIVEIEGYKFLVLDDVQLVVDNDHRGLENVLHQI